MIDDEDYLYFVDRALDGMREVLVGLGDAQANARPPWEGANSPYAVVNHCLGVIDTWVGAYVAGRTVDRDRDAEFTASGAVEHLVHRLEETRARLHEDVRRCTPGAPLRQSPPAEYLGPDRRMTQAGALQHVFEELAQHHGQVEVLRDVLLHDVGLRGGTRATAGAR